ncbi:tetratricopeptide repeat protein [bacterium]|nr:tetratricopeptide repeat protein [bacterium]
MKKLLLIIMILFVSVLTTACINKFAVDELNNKASDYMNKGDVEGAICRLKASLDLDDSLFQTHYNLGIAYINAGKYDEAIAELERTIALKEDYYPAYYSKAIALENKAYNMLPEGEESTIENIEAATNAINALQDAIDAFNDYIVKNVEAKETAEVNDKISDLNAAIKKYTGKYDLSSVKKDDEASQEPENNTQEGSDELNPDGTAKALNQAPEATENTTTEQTTDAQKG